MPTYFSDIPSETDLLGRFSFAREIAHSLTSQFKSGEDSIVIGINGKWGCGKSTLLKFIKDEINKETLSEKRIIFEFNPWLFSGQKELQVIFLNQLLEKMHDLEKRTQKLAKRTKRFLDFLKPIVNLIGKIQPVAKYVHSGLGEMIKDFEQFINAFDKDKPLDKVKERVDKQIEKSGVMFYIFIDDIERLTPEETTEVFQLIKLNANFKNTVYVIAYDREIVQDSLMQQYKEVGRRYLDKIVQVDYKVPEIFNEVLEDIFFEQLQIFFEKNNINYDTKHFFKVWQYNDFKGYFSTLRDIYRYINALQLRLPAIHSEITISDFLILEAIRLYDNFSYEEIYKAYRVCMIKRQSIQRVLSENAEFQAKSNPFSRSLIKAILQTERNIEINRDESKSISNPVYFERYFSLSLSSADVIGDIFNEFINQDKHRSDQLLLIFSGQKASYFIRRILNSPITLTDDQILSMILDIIQFGSASFEVVPMEKFGDQIFEMIDSLANNLKNKKEGYKTIFTELFHKKFFYNIFVLFVLGKFYEKITQQIQKFKSFDLENQHTLRTGKKNTAEGEYFSRIEETLQNSVEEMSKKEFLEEKLTPGHKFFESFFILKYADFFPNGHYKYLQKLISDRRKAKQTDIVGYCLEFNQISGKALNINANRLRIIIPSEKIYCEMAAGIVDYTPKDVKQIEIIDYVKRNQTLLQNLYKLNS